MLDIATCYVQRNGVLVVVSPSTAGLLAQRLDKHILYGDQVLRRLRPFCPKYACSLEGKMRRPELCRILGLHLQV